MTEKKRTVLTQPPHSYYGVTGEVAVELVESKPAIGDRKKRETRYAVYVDGVHRGFVYSVVVQARGAKIGRNVSAVIGTRREWRFDDLHGQRASLTNEPSRAHAAFRYLEESS